MSYSNTNACGDTCTAGNVKAEVPEPTMADILRETSTMAADALHIARRISSFLMAEATEDSERMQEPKCFREELMKTRYDLFLLNNELGRLASSLGVM